ncbi:MAG: ABC transporter permease [Proteobacteria bacterium]|nr:ABC transporter permease [Pseudomonadota bacterium]
MTARLDSRSRLRLLAGGLLGAIVLALSIVAIFWTPLDPNRLDVLHRLNAPDIRNLFGTDEFGRDVLSRAMTGGTTSLTVAILTVAAAIAVGSTIGFLTGFFRGWTDRLVMILNDTLLAFPGILLALGLSAVMGPRKYGTVLALSVAYTPKVMRVVRGTVMSLREREYIEASRALGNGPVYTLVRHIVPNAVAPIAVLATAMFGWAILMESALSFLGLGVPPPAATWGNMLATARPYLTSAPWLSVIPGMLIAATLLSVNLLGDSLRDWLDPRM